MTLFHRLRSIIASMIPWMNMTTKLRMKCKQCCSIFTGDSPKTALENVARRCKETNCELMNKAPMRTKTPWLELIGNMNKKERRQARQQARLLYQKKDIPVDEPQVFIEFDDESEQHMYCI